MLFAAALQPLAKDLRQAGLDIAVHYLDDGFLAGDVSAVSRALDLVQRRAAAIGLQLNLAKSKLVAVGRVDTCALHCHFPDALLRDTTTGSSKVRRDFEFLGAAIGDEAFIRTHTADRAAKAGNLLDSLGELEDPQVALRLLRSCAGFARLLHSMRCNPPSPQTMALDMFDGMVRRCFGDFTGLHLTASQWKQASLGFAHAGLGLRSTSHHAPAAYLASWAGTLHSASDIDASFCVEESKASPAVAALAAFNAQVDPARAIAIDAALTSKQQTLSHTLDAAVWDEQLAHSPPTDRATLVSEASVGGRAFLRAVPSGRTQMEPAVFVTELRARLRVAEADNETWRPLCDAVLDYHSYHAGMCTAGGERTQRHHAVRGEASAQNGSGPACFCPTVPRMSPTMLPGAALPMYTCLLSQGLLLPLTSPSRRHSGRSHLHWPASKQVRLQRPMLDTRREHRASTLSQWWLSAVAIGMQ